MIRCGSQCQMCDYPIHFDTYKGCSHNCAYCSGGEKTPINAKITPWKQAGMLKKFIEGKHNIECVWCDWDIPIHWGAVSDPFQPCERVEKTSLACLKLFAESHYPFIVSTKNPVLLTEEPYLSLIQQCRCVLQVSMACPKYDKLEKGAPSYEERRKAIAFLSDKVTRIIVRVMPYFPDCKQEIIAEIPRWKEAGVYGVQTAGFVTRKKLPGMEREGNKYRLPIEVLYRDFTEIGAKVRENGLKFFVGEGLISFIGDSLTCCGTMGLEDFKPNTYNLQHIAFEDVKPTEQMCKPHTAEPFKSLRQSQDWALHIYYKSFAEMMVTGTEDYVSTLRLFRERYGKDETEVI